jgi:hypothetical protein
MVESMASLAKYGASANEVLAYLLVNYKNKIKEQKHVFTPYEIAYLQACFLSGKHTIIQDGLKYISQMVLKEYTSQLQLLLNILNPLTIVMVGYYLII